MLRIDNETKENLDRVLNYLIHNSVASTKDVFYHPFSVPIDNSEIYKLKRLESLLMQYQLVSIANPTQRPLLNLFDLNLTSLGYSCKTIDGYIKHLEEQASIKQSAQSTPIINNVTGSSGVQIVNGSISGGQVVNETKEVETKPKSKNIGDYIKDFFSSTIVKIVAGIVGAAVLAYLGFK